MDAVIVGMRTPEHIDANLAAVRADPLPEPAAGALHELAWAQRTRPA